MWLGEALSLLGRFDEAEAEFARSIELMESSGECWAEAELFRLWAVMRQRSGAAGMEALLARALATARQQGAASWVSRAASEIAQDDEAAAARLRALVRDSRRDSGEGSPAAALAGIG